MQQNVWLHQSNLHIDHYFFLFLLATHCLSSSSEKKNNTHAKKQICVAGCHEQISVHTDPASANWLYYVEKARGGRIFNYSLRLHGYVDLEDWSLTDRLRWRWRKTGEGSILIYFFLLNWCLHLGVQSCFTHDHTCWDTQVIHWDQIVHRIVLFRLW